MQSFVKPWALLCLTAMKRLNSNKIIYERLGLLL